MVPGKRFDAPAKSPFMDMMLVPVYGGAGGDDQGTVTVSPRIQQNLGVRTAEVRRRRAAADGQRRRQHRLERARPVGGAGPRDGLHREAACARHARSRARRPAASPSSTCPSGWRRRRSTSRCKRLRGGRRRAGRRRAPAPAAGRHERSAGRARRCERAPCSRASRLSRRRAAWSRNSWLREGMTVTPGHDAGAHQRPGQRLGQCRGAGEPGRAGAPGQPGRGAQPRRARAQCSAAACRRCCPK